MRWGPYDARQAEVRRARSRARRDRFENGSEGVFCVNVLQILDIAINLAKSLKETEFTVAKTLDICGQGTKLLWGPYDSRQGEVRRARNRTRRDRFGNRSECVFCVNVLRILDIAINLAKRLKETELTVAKPL